MQYVDQQTLEFIESLDAVPGHIILAALEDEWWRSGARAAREGQPQTALWNHVQRAGYRAWEVTRAALQEQQREVIHA